MILQLLQTDLTLEFGSKLDVHHDPVPRLLIAVVVVWMCWVVGCFYYCFFYTPRRREEGGLAILLNYNRRGSRGEVRNKDQITVI